MNFFDRYIKFREELWAEFDAMVKQGAKFPELIDVTYPYGEKYEDLIIDSDGRYSFLAKELVPDPDYQMHIGVDIIVATGNVTFIDSMGQRRTLEPDIIDTYWLCQFLDAAAKYKR